MSLSSLIDYILKHNEAVIQWLIVVIIAMISFLAIRSVFRKPGSRVAGSVATGAAVGSSEQIEELLNKILEKTAKWDQSGATKPAGDGAASSSAESGVSAKELEAAKSELALLKTALEKKDAELAAAQSSGGSAAGDGGANKAHLDKIAELEAKLSEYEVLEDDIADLSLYKEENARLKAEVDRLRGGAVEDEPSMAPGVPEPDLADDLVREFAEAVGKDATPTTPVEELAAAESEPQLSADDLVVPEPEEISPLEAEKVESPELAAAPEPEMSAEDLAALNELAAAAADPAPEAGEAFAPTPTPQSQEAVDDLFAELASSDLDTDKVVSELAALQNIGASGSADDALVEDVDPDKIAEEADGLKS